jgi:hypothetical protein
MKIGKQGIIILMILIYVFVLTIDIDISIKYHQQEGNPISVYFYNQFGFYWNLIIPFAIICIPFWFGRTWDYLNKNFKFFLFTYIYLLIFITGHIAGIISWIR